MNKLAQKKILFIDKLASQLFPLLSLAGEEKMERKNVVAQAMIAINSAIKKTVNNPKYESSEDKLKSQLATLQLVYSQLSNDSSNRVDNLQDKINQARDAAKRINTKTQNLNNEVDRLYNLQSAAQGVAGEGRTTGQNVHTKAKEKSNKNVQDFQIAANLQTKNGILDGETQRAINKNPQLAKKHGLYPSNDPYPTDDSVFGIQTSQQPSGIAAELFPPLHTLVTPPSPIQRMPRGGTQGNSPVITSPQVEPRLITQQEEEARARSFDPDAP